MVSGLWLLQLGPRCNHHLLWVDGLCSIKGTLSTGDDGEVEGAADETTHPQLANRRTGGGRAP